MPSTTHFTLRLASVRPRYRSAMSLADWDDDVLQKLVDCCRAVAVAQPGPPAPATPPRKRTQATTGAPQSEEKQPPARAKRASAPTVVVGSQRRSAAGSAWAEHRRNHTEVDPTAARSCSKCQWAACQDRWRRRTPLDSSAGEVISWLLAKPVTTPDSAWGVGCKACAWSAKRGGAEVAPLGGRPYEALSVTGEGLRLNNFKRHAATTCHKEAVVAYLRHHYASKGDHQDLCGQAPAVQEFADAWKSLALGPQRQSRKCRTLEWCLFEACRDRELDFLRAATCMSIALDERDGRLLIKYAASNAQLEVRYGCLALLRDAGSNAYEIAAAVHKAVANFCTRRVLHPGLNAGKAKVEQNRSTQQHIRGCIEMCTADGAANEQLAAKLLHPASLRNSLSQKLPNLRLILRDRAHATRRLTERTFQADPKLEGIMQVVVSGETSVARLLKNSRHLRCIFEEEVKKQVRLGNAAGVQGSIRDMSFAKQRFDSTAKPLGRCLLNLDATISAMDIICRQRPAASKEHKGARGFLELLSEPKNLVLMGMLADASDECLVLTRFFDREAFRLEEMAEQLATFKQRLRWLFAGRGCLSIGYTSLALTHLHRAKLVPVPGRGPVALGGHGASPETVTECLGHMVAWSRLAEEVANTEFPEFELLSCFRVFRLVPAAQPTATTVIRVGTAGPAEQLDLERLAEAFQVDSAGLFDQFKEHQRIAQAELGRAPEEPAAQAWHRALKRTQSTWLRRRNFPAEALRSLLQRFMVAPGSTAGIEQNFSMFKRCLGEHWHGSPAAEERRLVLQLARAALPAADDGLLGAARRIWACTFKAPRKGAVDGKLFRGKAAPLQQAVRTAAAWLRRRRREVAVAPPAAATTDQAVEAAAAAAWTAKHEKEAQFQRAAHAKRVCAAVQEGVLRLEALGPDAKQQIADYEKQEQARQTNLDARQRLLVETLQPPRAPNLQGCRVFVDDEAKVVLNKWTARWRQVCCQAQLRQCADRAVAQVFVTLDPTAPGDRTKIVAAMTGAMLCTPELLVTPPGVSIKLKRAMSWPRHIFLSQACHDRHRVMIDLVQRVCRVTEEPCRWTWYLEAEGAERRALFLARAAKRDANHRQELVTLLAPGQNKSATFQGFPNCQTLSSFLVAIHRVDARFTHLGLCKR